jgi:aquaporin Z
MAVAHRIPMANVVPYWIAQVLGGAAGALVLYVIASGAPDFVAGGFASNGYGDLSPGHYSLYAAFVCEVTLTAFFILVILGATSDSAPAGFGPIAIGLCLTVIHLVSIPVTNTSVNPARSTAAALFAQTAALSQLWLFWIAPLIGGALGALVWRFLLSDHAKPLEMLTHPVKAAGA